MSTFQSAYAPPLQGVSQQLPESRLEGQVSAQENMVSDPVTGLRRRPGAQYAGHFNASDNLASWFVDIAGEQVSIVVDAEDGQVKIMDPQFNVLQTLQSPYLVGQSSRIRGAVTDNALWLANLDKVPVVTYAPNAEAAADAGFFYITSGAFSKEYSVTIRQGLDTRTFSYTTPSGSAVGDAAASTPEHIATQLFNSIATGQVDRIRFDTVPARLRVREFFPSTNTYGADFTVNFNVRLQKNTGTALTPTWVDVVSGDEFSPGEINNGKLRVLSPDEIPGSSSVGGLSGPRWFTYDMPGVVYSCRSAGVWSASAVPPTYTCTWRSRGLTGKLSVSSGVRSVFAGNFTDTFPIGGGFALDASRDGPYVFLKLRGGDFNLSSSSGSNFLITSRSGFVRNEGELPARLPAAADGYVCRVGQEPPQVYYRYTAAKTEWVEVGNPGGPEYVYEVPVSVRKEEGQWIIDELPFPGRAAGDDESNPEHTFMSEGITGLATFQGRLVILAGAKVSLSASGNPRQFFRTTVTSLLSSDPIEVGSSLNSSAAYEWALSFAKDLILFSRSYQAVIPSNNTAVTPGNATVVPTSTHAVDTLGSPITIGRTLLYCSPRSENFFGVMEMVPSQYTDSQYVSLDATPHLPKYMPGRCRFAVASSVAGMALFAPSGDPRSLIVHEYLWDGDQKAQQAWHRWTFEYPLSAAYFANDLIVLVFSQNGVALLATVDPKAGRFSDVGDIRPYGDFSTVLTNVDGVVTLPDWLTEIDPEAAFKVKLTTLSGPLAGELAGSTVESPELEVVTQLRLVRSQTMPSYAAGIPYYSGVVPTPPQVRDRQNRVVHGGKATLHSMVVGVADTSPFSVRVSDDRSSSGEVQMATNAFDSQDLALDKAPDSDDFKVVVPCRTDMRTSQVEIFTDGPGELNIKWLEYVGRYFPKIRRN